MLFSLMVMQPRAMDYGVSGSTQQEHFCLKLTMASLSSLLLAQPWSQMHSAILVPDHLAQSTSLGRILGLALLH